jgi:hypothetical protein
MKPSNSLFILIKSLTKSEKRYFKRFCTIYSKERQNNYLLLFNAIAEQKEYDELQIKSKFRNEKFVKQLNVLKVYLYRLIVKSLRQFYTTNDKDLILQDLIAHALILIKKRLYDECYRIINKAKETARFEKNLLTLAGLFALEKKLVGEMKIRNKEALLNKITFEEDVILTEISLYYKYTQIMNVLNTGLSSYAFSTLDKSNSVKWDHLGDNALLVKQPDTCSEETLYLYYICRLMLSIVQNSKEEILFNFERIICHIRENNSIINNTGRDSWSCLFYIIVYFLREGEFDEAENKLNRIKETILSRSKNDPVSHLFSMEIYVSIYELIISISISDLDRSSLLIERINGYFAKEQGFYTDQMKCIAYYFIALYYFIVNKHRLSLDYIKKFVKEYDYIGTMDLEYKIKILYVLNNYELGEIDHLEYYLINNLRVLRKKETSKEENLIFFRIFLKIIKSKTDTEAVELLKFLKHRFLLKPGQNESNISLQYFDIGIWIDSKLISKNCNDVV